MIVLSKKADLKDIATVINDAAIAYKGIIPEDRYYWCYGYPRQDRCYVNQTCVC